MTIKSTKIKLGTDNYPHCTVSSQNGAATSRPELKEDSSFHKNAPQLLLLLLNIVQQLEVDANKMLHG